MGRMGIVMPVFNGATYLESTLESVMASSVQPHHLVLVDDGSTDDSVNVAKECLAKASFKFEIISQINSGEATAVNEGVKRVDGDYVTIVNADDPIDPDLIKETCLALDSHGDAVVAYPDWRMIDKTGKPIREIQTQNFSRELLYGRFVCIPGPGAAIRISAIIGNLRDPRFSHVADYGTWLKLALQGDFIRVERVLANWRDHAGGQTARGKGALLAQQYVDLIDDFFDQSNLPAEISEQKDSGRASARFQAAVQGLFRPGVPARSLLAQSLIIGKWSPPPTENISLILAILALPFSRWALVSYYKIRKLFELK